MSETKVTAEEQALEQALRWKQPAESSPAYRVLAGFERYFDVRYLGTENLAESIPSLFVSNHSVMSIADVLAIAGIWRATGVLPRGLGDRIHFRLPYWRDALRGMGSVVGDRELTRGLLRAGQTVLVFPGGGREVMKKRSETHTLVWKQRTGFVRLAIEEGVPITPLAVWRGDDIFDFVADSDDYLRTPIGRLLHQSGILDRFFRGKDELPPLLRGIGLSMLPKPRRIYVAYGEPMDLSDFAAHADDPAALMEARERVAKQIDRLLQAGQVAESRDEQPSLLRRALTSL